MPKLSVTIVARNEEQNLPRALASVASIADEIIVTDTGSTDGTLDVARQFGARIGAFAWIDDFAAAHNHAKSLATGDWIFALDADEELLADSQNELISLLAASEVIAYHVLRQDLVDAGRPDHFAEMWQTRLYRNLPELRFQGRCHHHFSPSVEVVAEQAKLAVRESGVRLRHYGYLPTLREEKLGRAARLLELELQDRPGQFYYLVELGVTLLALRDERGLQRLAEAAQMINDRDPQVCGAPLAMLLEHILAAPKLPESFPLSREQATTLALQAFPDAPPLLWHIAGAHYGQGKFTEAAALLERLISLGQNKHYNRLVSFDPAIMGDDAKLNLAACWVRLGRFRQAKECLRALLDSPTRGQEAAANLKSIKGLRA